MSRKVGLPVWIILTLLCLSFLMVSSGYGFERKQPLPIPPHAEFRPPFSPEGEPWFCIIQYDSDSVAWYWDLFDAGDGIAVYMDPEECVFDDVYPFKISNVHFYLYDPEVFDWPVDIRVSALNVDVDTLIDTLTQPPDTVIVTPFPGDPYSDYSQTFSIEKDSAYDPVSHPNPMNLILDEVWCITSPFFLQITYTGGTVGSNPSLVMSHGDDLPDTNHNWLLWEGDYYEWDTAWVTDPHPGRAIMRVVGYPYAIDCNQLCWWWLPDTTTAPKGMPDFDQHQFGPASMAMCGPTAAANCLVWLDATPFVADPYSLVGLLWGYFNTDPDSGTLVDSITAGLNTLFEEYRLSLYSAHLQKPTFSEMVDSLNNPANIILLLGLWQNIDDSLYRIGGHYVSMAGACQGSLWTALSDPAADNAEEGGRGRFMPPHEPHPHDSTLHNTPGFVSHDAYLSDSLSEGPLAGAWILRDIQGEDLPWVSGFDGLNFQPGQKYHAYDPAESLYVVVEYAIMILETPPRDWDWMPPSAQAPNGMPDFDQRQFGDTSAFCGPTAAANCLVWLDAIPSVQNPDSLIRLLSDYFHTDPYSGTLVDSITAGLDSLFADQSLSLYSSRFENPVYSDVYDSLGIDDTLRKPAVLLVGLWQNIDDSLFRIGGHYVSVAGAYEDSSWTALSDPGADNAETGAKGRSLPSHNPHPDDDTLHNTPGYVSHDAYVSGALSLVPYAETVWRLTGYEDDSLPWSSQFEGQNFQPGQEQYRHDFDSTETLYAVVEYAIMFVQKPTLVEGEEGEVPRYFELRQSYPNPFNNHAVIKYSLSKTTDVSLVIYNILGQKVRTLVENQTQIGDVSVIWDGKDDRGRDLSSGIYFYRLRAGQLTETRRMVLLK